MKRKRWLLITGIAILLIGIVGLSKSVKEKAETRMAEAEKGEREEERIELEEGKKEEETEEKEKEIKKEGKEIEKKEREKKKLTRLQKEYLKELKRLGKQIKKEDGGDESRKATFVYLEYFQNLLHYVKSEKELEEILSEIEDTAEGLRFGTSLYKKSPYHYYRFSYYGFAPFGSFGTLESNWSYLVVADKGKLSMNVLYEQTPYYLMDLYEMQKGKETYLMITGRSCFYHPYPIFISIWKVKEGNVEAVPLIYETKEGSQIKVDAEKNKKEKSIEFTFQGNRSKQQGYLDEKGNGISWCGYKGVQFEMKMKKKKKKIEFYCHGVGIEEPIARLYIRKGEAIIKEGEKMRGKEEKE